MKLRSWRPLAALAVLGLLLFPPPVKSGNQSMQKFVLFAGGDTDSTQQESHWIPIRGAQRIMIRTFSSHVVWAADNADSTFSDSLGAFNVLLSDSLSFIAADSAGSVITLRSTVPHTPGTISESYPIAADSIVIPLTTVGDTTFKLVGMMNLPINKELRAPANGSGIWTAIYPKVGVGTTTLFNDSRAVIPANFMKVKAIPLRRSTVSGFSSTQGKRVNGLKGFKMEAYVYFDNR